MRRTPREPSALTAASIALVALTVLVALRDAPAAPDATARRAAPDTVLVPAGTFIAGTKDGPLDERPRRTLRLPAYRIDRTEVTRAAYARCVAARRCARLTDAATDADPRLPVTGVTWAEARAYCRWVGGRLPSEAEWEKAARGADGRAFPWGDAPDCARGNWGNFDGEGPCAAQSPGHPVPVGSYPQGASPHGALDLAGNVWEWVEDTYDDDTPGGPARRGVRGGSCCSYFVEPRAANRNAWAPDHRDGDLGFRCAYRAGR
jgi:formylglycine-generating enzyme required for sulfatase activity